MKINIKRTLLFSSLIIILPMFYGIFNLTELPANMATHWGFNNQANGYMPKLWFVYGFPIGMLLFQWFLVTITHLSTHKNGGAPRLERTLYMIIPIISIIAYLSTIQINLGSDFDIRRIAMLIIAIVFILIGNYLPTASGKALHIGGPKLSQTVAVRANRRVGYGLVFGGILCLLSNIGGPVLSVLAIVLTVAWTLVVYGMALKAD